MKNLCIKIHEKDNVAVAIRDLPKGTVIMDGVTLREDIPQAHKIALTDIPKGGEVLRYGKGARDDSIGMQYLIPGWKFDNKKPCMVR